MSWTTVLLSQARNHPLFHMRATSLTAVAVHRPDSREKFEQPLAESVVESLGPKFRNVELDSKVTQKVVRPLARSCSAPAAPSLGLTERVMLPLAGDR